MRARSARQSKATPMLSLFLKALIIGFSIAAPVGPIGLLCIQRSLNDGFKIGFGTGLGAATADGVFGFIAAAGITAISALMLKWQFAIHLLGGLFLLYLGVGFLRTKLSEKTIAETKPPSALKAYSSTFVFTLTNPLTIISFMAIFASLGNLSQPSAAATLVFVAGVTLGSAVWWLFLSGALAFFIRHKITAAHLQKINILSGLILIAFAAYAMWSSVKP